MGNTFWQLFIEIKYICVIFAKDLVKLGIPTNCKSHTVISAANRHMLTLTVRPSVRCVPNTHNPMTSQPSRAPNCNCKCSVSKCLYWMNGWIMMFRGNVMSRENNKLIVHPEISAFQCHVLWWEWISLSRLWLTFFNTPPKTNLPNMARGWEEVDLITVLSFNVSQSACSS